MFASHGAALAAGYAAAMVAWWIAAGRLPAVWPGPPEPTFERPWREFGWAMLGVVGVIAVGQLWVVGIRLSEEGPGGTVMAAVNQAFIFAPILLVVPLRRHRWTSAWVYWGSPRTMALRLAVGVVVGAIAVTVYSMVRTGADTPLTILSRIVVPTHADEALQVLLEDIAVAILFVRLQAAIGARWAVGVVATLFAAGHVPTMLAEGRFLEGLPLLLVSVGLGVGVLAVVRRSRDVVWLWCVHFCMDMTQFAGVSGVG